MGAGCGLPAASRLAQSSAAPIGAVDLPMPRKLRRRHIPQRRVQPLSVVNPLDERANFRLRLAQCGVLVAVDFLGFERLHKTLDERIVVGVSPARH